MSTELSEIRRCTAELSSRYRLKSRHGNSRDFEDSPSSSAGGGTTAFLPPTTTGDSFCSNNATTPSTLIKQTTTTTTATGNNNNNNNSSNCNNGLPHRKIKYMSQFYVLPDKQQIMTTPITAGTTTTQGVLKPGGIKDSTTARCRSEPPFSGDEGLYRAQSCPGLPQPLLERVEGHETVSELRPSVLRLRTDRTPPSRDKLLNRWVSAGTSCLTGGFVEGQAA